MALEDLGFKNSTKDEIITSIRAAAQHTKTVTGITAKDAASKLIILLAKYTIEANDISYGGRTSSVSNYYINTMEICFYTPPHFIPNSVSRVFLKDDVCPSCLCF